MEIEILDILKTQTHLNIELLKDKSDVYVAKIDNLPFVALFQPTVTQGNRLLVLQQLMNMAKNTKLPSLLLTKYIPSAIANEYITNGVNYIDAAGNCSVKQGSLFVYIRGNKQERKPKTNQPRAFQETGIKLIFNFLCNPENINFPYRELAEKAGIALGSVSAIINELTDLNFILQTNEKRVLKNKKELLNRWVTAYNDWLRPRLLKKRMRFAVAFSDLSKIEKGALWGGEPAANLITNYLSPGFFTIYTTLEWQALKTMYLVPDENGNVEILQQFWQQEGKEKTVPPLLVYADLMNSGFGRNLETAQIILENELPYIK